MTYTLGSSGLCLWLCLVSFVCLFVILSVFLSVCLSVSPFSQPCFIPETVTIVSYPGMANHRSLLNLRLIRPC